MKCPKCRFDTKIKETLSDVNAVYRRRNCKGCGFTFYTVEMGPGSGEEGQDSIFGINPVNKLALLRSRMYYKKKEKKND